MERLGEKLGYVVAPLLTPFYRDSGEVNYEMVEKLIEHLLNKKFCTSIVVNGSTGEFSTLSHEERLKLYKTVKITVRGRVPLVAGTGAASTKEAIKLTKAAEELEYDCAMVVGPYYCRPTQEGIYRHFAEIAVSTKLPILLYNIPIFTGTNIEPETVGRLARDFENIVGIKDESGINPTQMTDYKLVTSEDFTVYNGDDIMILCGLSQGASGVVSGGAHVFGDKILEMIEAFKSGDIKKAEVMHYQLYPFFKALCQNGRINPQPILKEAVKMIGLDLGYAREPLDRATDEEINRLKNEMERLGAFD